MNLSPVDFTRSSSSKELKEFNCIISPTNSLNYQNNNIGLTSNIIKGQRMSTSDIYIFEPNDSYKESYKDTEYPK